MIAACVSFTCPMLAYSAECIDALMLLSNTEPFTHKVVYEDVLKPPWPTGVCRKTGCQMGPVVKNISTTRKGIEI